MNDERRPISWGKDEDAILAAFVIDVTGSVFNAATGRPADAVLQHEAARVWNKTGRGLWYPRDSTAANGRGPRRPHLRARELVRTRPDGREVTQWLYCRKTAVLPLAVTPRPGELPLVGDPSDNWCAISLPRQYASVFHGPSMAAWIFGMTHVDPGPFGPGEPPRDGDHSSTK